MSKYTKLYMGSTALYIAGISLAYAISSNSACCAEDKYSTSYKQQENAQMLQYGHIDGKALKNLIDTKTPMTILDARGGQWDDGRRIPGGKSLPVNSPTELFAQVVPDKNTLVVVYCGSTQCPVGKILAERMVGEGYTHVLKYAGGIKEWADEMNFPVENNGTNE